MKVRTLNVDSETLSTQKRVKVSSKQQHSPGKALQVGKLRTETSETVSPLARGFAEIYAKANSAALENTRKGWSGLANRLQRQSKRALDDEIVVPFIEYDDTAALQLPHAKEIVKLQANYGDIISAPLMTPLVRAADDGDGLGTSHVSAIIENTRVFLKAVNQLQIGKPVMGVIPPISAECTERLVELYFESDLRAYCVDFNRRSPMAQSQIDNIVNPLMQALNNYNIRERSLTYAVNPKERRPIMNGRYRPAEMYAYTLGFDVVGDNHIGVNMPEEVIEALDPKTELRLFDADTVSVVDVPLSGLDSFLPDEAEIPVDRVRRRMAKNPNEGYRFEKLINAELISLYLEAEGGVNVQEIYQELLDGEYTQESDLNRVQELVSDVMDDS